MATIKILRLFFFLFFISCNSQHQFSKNKVVDYGRYNNYRYAGDPFNSESITISENNKVNYDLKINLFGDINLTGKWSIVKDTLEFSFELPPIKKIGGIKIIYEKEKHNDFINVKINDTIGLLFGGTIFINNQKYYIDSENLKIKPQYIDTIKVLFDEENYEISIKSFVNSDFLVFITPTEFRDVIYDYVKTKWLIRENRIIEINENKLNEKHYLIKQNE